LSEAEKLYTEALNLYRVLASITPTVYGYHCANTLVMGVSYYDRSKNYLDEALKYLEPYSNSHLNVKLLKYLIKEFKQKI